MLKLAALFLLLSLPLRLGGCARTIVVVQGPLVSCATSPAACQPAARDLRGVTLAP